MTPGRGAAAQACRPGALGRAGRRAARAARLEGLAPGRRRRRELGTASRAPAPGFTLDRLGEPGQGLRSPPYRGRPVVLNFFASWCVPCTKEAPTLEAAGSAWKPRASSSSASTAGLQRRREAVRRASTASRTRSSARARATVVDAYGVTGVPETFFVDRRRPARGARAAGRCPRRATRDRVREALRGVRCCGLRLLAVALAALALAGRRRASSIRRSPSWSASHVPGLQDDAGPVGLGRGAADRGGHLAEIAAGETRSADRGRARRAVRARRSSPRRRARASTCSPGGCRSWAVAAGGRRARRGGLALEPRRSRAEAEAAAARSNGRGRARPGARAAARRASSRRFDA